VRLSRETVRIIRQNILVFAFGVNVVGVLLTAWLWPLILPAQWYGHGPIAAVVYHQLGSLAVLLNSMRLLGVGRGPGPAARRWQGRFRAATAWLERRLDVDEALHGLAHRWRLVTSVTLALALIAYAISGARLIQADEVGIVRRFGQALPEDLAPGLHVRWPWPIETVTRVRPARVYSLEVGFRLTPGSQALPGARAWSSPHSADGLARDADEAVMISGD